MFVECFTNNGKPYLRLVQSVRITKPDGKKVPQKQVVHNIGPLDRFDDGEPDFVERLKKSFSVGNPMIPDLLPYCPKDKLPATFHFSIREGSPNCLGHPKIFSYLFLERILEELGLRNFFASYKGFTKIKYDVYGFAKLLIFGRLLNPASKCGTVRQNNDYYEPILDDFNPDNVYDTLSFIAENKNKIIQRINTNLVNKAGRSPKAIYYDVTNFYYEIEDADDDILDENGVVIETGRRKYGVCKEERRLPIIQMGLFMDDDGIPIAIESFPGNTLDHLTLRPAMKKTIDNIGFKRFILIADRGICNYMNLLHVVDAGNGYIVSKSLLKSTKKEQAWAYDDNGYVTVSPDFMYKSHVVKRKVKDEYGNERTIEELVVVYWSKKFELRSIRENKKFLDFLQNLEKAPANFRITAMQSKQLRRFLKKECINTDTGEFLNTSDIKALIDFDKVSEYKKSLGYYQLVSSELTMAPLEVIDKYHGLTQIEDQFRVMKGDLSTRPLRVWTSEHIDAHLLICLIALIILRIIQKRIRDKGLSPRYDVYWNVGMSGERIQAALNKWKVEALPDDLYRFIDIDDPDLSTILKAFDIEIPLKLYRRAELKSIKTETQIFM